MLAAIAALFSTLTWFAGRQHRLASHIDRLLAIAERLPDSPMRRALVERAERDSARLVDPPAETPGPFPESLQRRFAAVALGVAVAGLTSAARALPGDSALRFAVLAVGIAAGAAFGAILAAILARPGKHRRPKWLRD